MRSFGTTGEDCGVERADAVARMREALVLLDRLDRPLAACHLQMAIDLAEGEPTEIRHAAVLLTSDDEGRC